MSMILNDASSLVRLQWIKPDKVAIRLLPESVAREYMVVPLRLDQNDLIVACTDPLNLYALRQLQAVCRRPIRALWASYSEISNALNDFYRGQQPAARPSLDLGGILYQLGYLTPETLARLRSIQQNSAETAFQICRRERLVDDENLAEAAGLYCSLPHFRLRGLNITPDLSILFSWDVATNRKVIPLWWIAGTLVVATPELQPGDYLDGLSEDIGLPIQPLICSYSDWELLYKSFYLRGYPGQGQQGREVAQWLLERGILSNLDLDHANAASQQSGRTLVDILVGSGLVSGLQWLQAQSDISGIPIATSPRIHSNGAGQLAEVYKLLPISVARRFNVLPLRLDNSRLILAIANPDRTVVRLVASITGLDIVPYLMTKEEIEGGLDLCSSFPNVSEFCQFPGVGELLLRLGVVSKTQLAETQPTLDITDQACGKALIQAGYLDELSLIEALSLKTGIPCAGFDHARFQPLSFSDVPLQIIREHLMLPFWSSALDLWVAISDPLDQSGLRKIEKASGKRVWPIIAPRSVLLSALERLGGDERRRSVDPRVLDLFRDLIGAGYLTQVSAVDALNKFSREDECLDKAIAEVSPYSQSEIAQAIAKMAGLPFVDLQLVEQVVERIGPLGQQVMRTQVQDPVDVEAARSMSLENAQRLAALPIRFGGRGELVVAFADPFFDNDQIEFEENVSWKIIPVIANRQDLEEAIQRVLGQRNIGTLLQLDGVISRSQLNEALDFARSTGVRLGQALVNRKYITDYQLYLYLSKQTSLPLYDLDITGIDEQIARLIPAQQARQEGVLPLYEEAGWIVVATVDPLNTQALNALKEQLGKEIAPVLVTEKDFSRSLEALFSGDYLTQSISDLLERTPEDSAYRVLSVGQIISLILILVLSVAWISVSFTSWIIMANALSTIFYFSFSIYKFYLVYRALTYSMEVPVEDEELQALNDRDLPIYTILVPVYKEANVLPELLGILNRLDYPSTKLDIQVLLEEDDRETIAAFNSWNGPSHFHGVVVPYGEPKTKPKACNYGLIHARGDYVVIFDAEDIPEPDQLKKALVAFSKSPARVACIQAKLNYYNSNQNILTHWFTVEYSMWFDLLLPGLSASSAPIPLGGTSNHFKREVLIEVGAWDPYNVTEDADLGVRLFKRGYKTAIIDSTTYEEANSQLYNWVRQRSRWIKGYIQSWLVHMRNPLRLIREIGVRDFFSFQFVVGGTFFAALMNPVYWFLTSLWFFVHWHFIETIFPGIVYFLGAVALFFGNFAFTYMNVAGALRREKYNLVRYALLSPLYWGLASIAAWMGFIQLLYKPHFWEKTIHGLYNEESTNRNPPPIA